jgi:peroxiredoxin
VAVNRRLLAATLAGAAAISIAAGWALSRDGSSEADASGDDVVEMSSPGTAQIPSIETNPQVSGDVLPAVDLQTNDGQAVSTADLLGEPLVINFWYSTCAPCKHELPAFATVSSEYADRVRFVGVNPYDTADTNESFARDKGVPYQLLRDPDGAYLSAIRIATAPFTLFVAADGTIVRQTGVLDEDQLRTYVEELLT